MKRRTRLVVAFLGLCLIGGGGILLSSGLPVHGQGQVVPQAASSAVAQQRLGIEIDLKKPFYIPAATNDRGITAFIRVPIADDKESQPGRISAIKLAPKLAGDRIEVSVSAVYGDSTGIKACKDWDALKQVPIASYTLREGERIAVSQLTELGADFKGGTLTFKAVLVKAAPAQTKEGGCECGWCGGLACCPNSGFCITCGSCGSVCCA